MATPNPFTNRKVYRLRRRRRALNPSTLVAAPGGSPPAAASGLEEKVDKLSAENEQLGANLKDAQERLLRIHADHDNQRRRHQKEKEDIRKYATESLMEEICPAMDHFGLALQSMERATEVASVRQGVEMIHRELLGILKSNGLEPVEALGAPFDPNLHEAVAAEANSDAPDNTILEVMRPGWLLRGRVIRPAMVKVNKLNSSSTPAAEG